MVHRARRITFPASRYNKRRVNTCIRSSAADQRFRCLPKRCVASRDTIFLPPTILVHSERSRGYSIVKGALQALKISSFLSSFLSEISYMKYTIQYSFKEIFNDMFMLDIFRNMFFPFFNKTEILRNCAFPNFFSIERFV